MVMDTRRSSLSSRSLHVVMCPWLAFGHLLPFLDLAERLASRGHSVTFVSTPRNIARLPPPVNNNISFVALPLPHVDGLPDGAESTHDIPADDDTAVELLWKAFDGLAAPFAEFLAAACSDDGDDFRRPDCVIFDIFHYWAAAAAREHKVSGVMFQISSAHNIAAYDRHWREHAGKAADESDEDTDHVDQRRLKTLELCTLAAVSSCKEWEPELVPFVETLGGKPVFPLGLLPPPTDDHGRHRCRRRVMNREEEDNDDVTLLHWLDGQPANSVVYVALGSEVPLSMEQVHELALGLELAGTRFLWALRRPRSGNGNGNGNANDNSIPGEEDILPPGFLERTQGRGIVAFGWVPQIRILAHDAVGAFLTHCGWGSTVQGPMFGHPLVLLPIAWDQWSNARLLEGKKVGVHVPRDDDDDEKDRSAFSRDGVASAVRPVMTEVESRRVFVENARKLQAVVCDRELQERYIDGFVEELMHLTRRSEVVYDEQVLKQLQC